MINDTLYIVQFNSQTKELKLINIANARQNPNFSFEAVQAQGNDDIKIKSSFINPEAVFTTNPMIFNLKKPAPPIVFQYTYGYLYNWYVANHSNFCPSGWHVPTREEFNQLITFCGGQQAAGNKLKEAGTLHWSSTSQQVDNQTGFTCLPGGRLTYNGAFQALGTMATFWLSSELDEINAYCKFLYANAGTIADYYNMKSNAYSIRLIKDDDVLPASLTDIDGNIYPVCKIGDQVWLASNWKCTKLNNGTPINNLIPGNTWYMDPGFALQSL